MPDETTAEDWLDFYRMRNLELSRALDTADAKLRDAYALIRWCYHDRPDMPPNYAEIIAAAKAAS